jgi:predicted dehydrogenase
MSVRIGVIGVGYLGQHHARIFSAIEGAELVAVADIQEKRASDIAARYGCKSFKSYLDMIDECDALSIVTPTTGHHAIAMECLRAGKDILIEKPITAGIAEAKEVIAEAARNHLILQVGHLERYNPAIVAAAEMIKKPRFIESERLSPFLGRGIDVDVTLDLMIHDIDIVMSITQSGIKDIRAAGESIITGKIDVAKAWIEFENGCKALITASRLASEKKRVMKIFQQDAYILIDFQTTEVKRYSRNGSDISCEMFKPDSREPLMEELRDFIDCVRIRKKPRVSGIEAMEALKAALRITQTLSG